MAHGKFLYYSTNTRLAYRITIRYFGGQFYVYCAEAFNPGGNPDSSNPSALYRYFQDAATGRKTDAQKITNLKNILKRVAAQKRDEGLLTEKDYRALILEVTRADSSLFAPVIYLILRDAVQGRAEKAPLRNSIEYIIADLQEADFEIITE